MSFRYQKVSGAQVGKRAHKIIGCESCNFAANPKLEKFKGLKTGNECPSCKGPLRLFDSKAEHQRACELQMLERTKTIESLEYQPKFPLHVVNPDGKKVKIYTYISDFRYISDGRVVIEDVKGYNKGRYIVTDVSAMKIKHAEAEYNIKIDIIGR